LATAGALPQTTEAGRRGDLRRIEPGGVVTRIDEDAASQRAASPQFSGELKVTYQSVWA
jgi:hypothetical protein